MPVEGIFTVTAGVVVLNVLLGAGLVYAVFSLMEKNPVAGLAGGGLAGLVLIFVEAIAGERFLTPSVSEMKVLVIAAAAGGVIGVVGMVMLMKPDLD